MLVEAMKPLSSEHQGWKIRVVAHPVGRVWSALIEVWPPGSVGAGEARIVPFSATLASEKQAQVAGRTAAVRWIEREANRG